MPFIHIRSLPFDPPLDVSAAVTAISVEFATATQIDIEHVTVGWEFLSPGHCAVAGVTAHRQRPDSHPVLVAVLAPDFNDSDRVETMLRTLAASIVRVSGVLPGNVFINYREAHSGQVFDAGDVVTW